MKKTKKGCEGFIDQDIDDRVKEIQILPSRVVFSPTTSIRKEILDLGERIPRPKQI